jgi:hypothetical protein
MTLPGSARGAVAAARLGVLVVAGILALSRPAAADTTTLNVTDAPIVRVNLKAGDVTIRTWDRPVVQVDGDPSLTIERRVRDQSGSPDILLIPRVGPPGNEDGIELPAENFVVGAIPAGPRETIVVNDLENADQSGPSGGVVVTIPSDSAFVFAHTAHGNLEIRNYRAGTLIAFAGSGRMTLAAVGGIVFAQAGRGPIVVTDSSIDRLRARSLTANITFERCRVRQIEVTTGTGSIVYDGGAFDAGIARFESVRGNVAIGSVGPVQFSAHAASDDRVFTSLGHDARLQGAGDNGEQALLGEGGPVVTATTQAGNVYLYEGSLHRKHPMGGEWSAPLATLQRPGVATRHPAQPPAPPRVEAQPPPPAFRKFRRSKVRRGPEAPAAARRFVPRAPRLRRGAS